MSRTVRPALAAGVLGVALALASCSSTDSSTTTPAPSGTGEEDATADQRAAEAEQLLAGLETTDVDVTAQREGYPAAVGEEDAAVTMVVFEDYLCQYCQTMATDTLPELQDLVDDGTLRIEHRDIGVLAEQSVTLAEAAWAAAQQGSYTELHESLMADPMAPEQVSEESLAQRATELGLDTGQFTEALAGPTASGQVSDNTNLAMEIGLTGTPTTVVEGYMMSGLQDPETLRLVVEGVLAGGEAASGATA